MTARDAMTSVVSQWQMLWGTPRAMFFESEGWKMEVAFVLAIIFHVAPFGYLWQKQVDKKLTEVVTLQNVDLIEPEEERPAAPPVEVQKPKSALEFLKMALPTFTKPEAPRDIALQPKIQEPKLAEPDKLIEKAMPKAPPAPEIKLDANKNMPAPKIADISKIPTQRAPEVRTADPSLKLEEVGRRAVAPPPMAPAISMNKSQDRMADVQAMPKIANIPQARVSASDRLVEKTAPTAYKPPSSAPLGYARRDAGSVSLDQPREVVRSAPKPAIQQVVPAQAKAENPAKIEISKDKVRITGPLSSRKALKSYVPDYPAWARERNIEADVAIRFYVSAEGDVRDNAVVERTSGYIELDKLALAALKSWKFSRLSGQDQDQWGVITFRFLLN